MKSQYSLGKRIRDAIVELFEQYTGRCMIALITFILLIILIFPASMRSLYRISCKHDFVENVGISMKYVGENYHGEYGKYEKSEKMTIYCRRCGYTSWWWK